MSYRLLRVISGALVLTCAAAPGFATVITRTPAVQMLGPVRGAAPPRRSVARYARVAGLGVPVAVATPSGCTTNGPNSFVGEPGRNAQGVVTNFAGGGADNEGLAGVTAGSNNEACDGWSAVGAGISNVIGGNGLSAFAVIAGGQNNGIVNGGAGFIGGGQFNSLWNGPVYNTASFSAIVGGASNTVGSPQSFIGAGFQNNVVPNSTTVSNTFGQSAFIGAGLNNTVAGNFDGIVAGQSNSVSPDNSTIVGGTANTISTAGTVLTNGQSAFIGSGYKNTVSANFAAVVGGYENTATANYGAVSGGRYNIVSGYGAAVPGGSQNVAAGEYSFAAGSSSHAANAGTFVWSDDASDATTLTTTANNQFKARAAGGYFLYSAANLSTGVTLAPGSGSWSSVSDRAAKTAFEDIDDARILAKVAALPVSEWSYSAQGTGIRHLGPMAQDFRAAFGLGEDDKHITTIDEEGVALAAIKALQAEVSAKDGELEDNKRHLRDNERQLDGNVRELSGLALKYTRLEQRLEALEQNGQTNASAQPGFKGR